MAVTGLPAGTAGCPIPAINRRSFAAFTALPWGFALSVEFAGWTRSEATCKVHCRRRLANYDHGTSIPPSMMKEEGGREEFQASACPSSSQPGPGMQTSLYPSGLRHATTPSRKAFVKEESSSGPPDSLARIRARPNTGVSPSTSQLHLRVDSQLLILTSVQNEKRSSV